MKCPYRFMLPEDKQGCVKDECMLFECGGHSTKGGIVRNYGRCGLSNTPDYYVVTDEQEESK
jgi:hypothetical protein